MKRIGRGWQYTVYDIGNGRVRKVFNTRMQAYGVFLRECFPYVEDPVWKFPAYHRVLREKAEASLDWMRTSTMDPKHFGNVHILNSTDYEQDKVMPLGSYLSTLSTSEGKGMIDEFVRFNLLLSANSVIDKSFLIGKNYGIDRQGNIILTDIGELYFDEKRIQDQIAERPWDHPYVTRTIPRELRAYFVEVMDKAFSAKA